MRKIAASLFMLIAVSRCDDSVSASGDRQLGNAVDLAAPLRRLNLACYNRAREETLLDEGQAKRLCVGARSDGPAVCFKAARDRTQLSDSESILLCRCARSDEPVSCYELAKTDYARMPRGNLVDACRVSFYRIFCPR
jgi:hypothetical protein